MSRLRVIDVDGHLAEPPELWERYLEPRFRDQAPRWVPDDQGRRRLLLGGALYGYRRITALLNRDLAADGRAPANHKRIYRLMKVHGLLLEKHGGQRPGRSHDGKVVMMRSDLCWCSDGFEFTCWNGEIVRGAFVLDAHDREVIAWRATTGAGISGSDIRDMMLEAVEARYGGVRAPHPVEWLSDNGSIYTARDTRVFASPLNLVPCFTPVASPESNGMSKAFVKTLKRDYLRVSPVPDAKTALDQFAGWFDDYNENHPHPGSGCARLASSDAPLNPPRCPVRWRQLLGVRRRWR
jgi:transposase InsO family protein